MSLTQKQLVSRLHALRGRMHRDPSRLGPGHTAQVGLIDEFNELRRDCQGNDQLEQAMGLDIEYQPKVGTPYAVDVSAYEFERRLDQALSSLGSTLLVDNAELRSFIKEQFADSHVLLPKRQVWVSIAVVLLAILGINWTSVRIALNSSAVTIATQEAEAARDRAVQDADAVQQLVSAVRDETLGIEARFRRVEARADSLLEAVGQLAAHYQLSAQAFVQLFGMPAFGRFVSGDALLAFQLQESSAKMLSSEIEYDVDRVSAHSEGIVGQYLTAGVDE